MVVCSDGSTEQVKVEHYGITGLKRTDVNKPRQNRLPDGAEDITIGETICDLEYPEPLPFIDLMSPRFYAICGEQQSFRREGRSVCNLRHLQQAFQGKGNKFSLKVEQTDSPITSKFRAEENFIWPF